MIDHFIADKAAAVAKIAKVNLDPEIRKDVARLGEDLNAVTLAKESAIIQAIEVVNISQEVDAIEADFNEKGIRLPTAITIFTAGFKPPTETSQKIAKYGEFPYQGLFPAGIAGHECQVLVTTLTNQSNLMVLEGRSIHGYEADNLKEAPIVTSHMLNLMKEYIRRRRAKGVEVPFIPIFLTGADFQTGNTKVGELTVLMDDTELNNNSHPGAGPNDIKAKYFGNVLVGKAGKAADPELVRLFLKQTKKLGLIVHPGVGVGTPGAPEFQSAFERALLKMAFDSTLKTDLLKAIIRPIFGWRWRSKASLIYNMNITTDLSVFRQLKFGEPPIRILPLGLVTDLVGDKDSLNIDHGVVFSRAIKEAEKYIPAVITLANEVSQIPFTLEQDFSIRAQLIAEGVYK